MQMDALPIGAHHDLQVAPAPGRRRLASFPAMKDPERLDLTDNRYCVLLVVCDGLLLFRLDVGHYVVCNPTTRRWADLPRLPGGSLYVIEHDHREAGFYFHPPSGEYRLLCHCNPRSTMAVPAHYAVLSVGAVEPRRLEDVQATPIPNPAIPQGHPNYKTKYDNLIAPAALHGRLHWLEHPEAGLTDQMVVFDTVAETFSRMTPPPVTSGSDSLVNLLSTDGSLMASRITAGLSVDLWVLEGYGAAAMDVVGRWELRHRVDLPYHPLACILPNAVAGGDDGDVILGTPRAMRVYNVRTKTVRIVDDEPIDRLRFPEFPVGLLRENMVPHAFFHDRGHPSCLPLFHFLP
ncbi:hypothetical protein ABZP36_001513 [Zizania latifolia]